MLSVSAEMTDDVNLRQEPVNGGNPYFGARISDTELIAAYLDETGHELWGTDGTADGTTFIKDLFPGPQSSGIRDMTAAEGLVYFEVDDGIHGREVWRSDGTADGTFMVKEITPGANSLLYPREFTPIGERVLFVANDGAHGLTFGRRMAHSRAHSW